MSNNDATQYIQLYLLTLLLWINLKISLDFDVASHVTLCADRRWKMGLMTISEVVRAFGVSTRALRYYDEIGLLPSARKDGYAYRAYDETAVKRLRQIITLRKLRVPLKQIAVIFGDCGRAGVTDILQEVANECGAEIHALQTVRGILQAFIERLNRAAGTDITIDALNGDEIMDVIQSLPLSKTKLKEERTMDELNKADQTLSALRSVRIIYLPPCTVAASHYFGDHPEMNAHKPLENFIREIGLTRLMPGFREFGFNNPCPKGDEAYGYEFWATIPDDLDVPAPLVKKTFAGGLYAAHCIKMGDFHEWQWLTDWVNTSAEYDSDNREPAGMFGLLEEHLNAYTYYVGDATKTVFVQLDLLAPIKPK